MSTIGIVLKNIHLLKENMDNKNTELFREGWLGLSTKIHTNINYIIII